MTNDVIYEIIKDKVPEFAEVVTVLFEHCNMTCSFCPQDHDSTFGADRDQIMSKVPLVVDWINNNHKSKFFKLHILGGEVFQDVWIEKGFLDIYQEYIDAIAEGITDPEKELHPNFVTNLVFEKTDKVMELLERNNIKVSISYDSTGRFNKSQFETFKRNIEIFKDRISMVSVAATATNMKSIIAGDEYFDYLYSLYDIDFDSYLPANDDKKNLFFMPKESELLAFNKHLVEHYPKCTNIAYFVEPSQNNRMSCTRGNSLQMFPNNYAPKGCSGAALTGNTDVLETVNAQDGELLENFFAKYNCFECEYFSRCPFTCFVKQDTKKLIRDIDGCVFKETFKFADSLR